MKSSKFAILHVQDDSDVEDVPVKGGKQELKKSTKNQNRKQVNLATQDKANKGQNKYAGNKPIGSSSILQPSSCNYAVSDKGRVKSPIVQPEPFNSTDLNKLPARYLITQTNSETYELDEGNGFHLLHSEDGPNRDPLVAINMTKDNGCSADINGSDGPSHSRSLTDDVSSDVPQPTSKMISSKNPETAIQTHLLALYKEQLHEKIKEIAKIKGERDNCAGDAIKLKEIIQERDIAMAQLEKTKAKYKKLVELFAFCETTEKVNLAAELEKARVAEHGMRSQLLATQKELEDVKYQRDVLAAFRKKFMEYQQEGNKEVEDQPLPTPIEAPPGHSS